MRIALNTPFTPLDHPRVSGTVTIFNDIAGFLKQQGHELHVLPHLYTKYIWQGPDKARRIRSALHRAEEELRSFRADCLFTYHTYYKAPDILGPALSLGKMPYFIFAASYATKHRRDKDTRPGFFWNKHALLSADRIFINKRRDLENVGRLADTSKVIYVRPGIHPERYRFSAEARERIRSELDLRGRPVLVSAAMLRQGVKAQGMEYVIRAAAESVAQGVDVTLLIVGDGSERGYLENLAKRVLPDRHRFVGKIEREHMQDYYSAGDLFAFPGINEALGMVYLEAQSCGLPVVAWDHDGAPEVVQDGITGRITPSFDDRAFSVAITELLRDYTLRKQLGEAAAAFVADKHDLKKNYSAVEEEMLHVVDTM